jgi:hypothetical protein
MEVMKKKILNISSKLLDRQVDFFKKLMSRLNGGGHSNNNKRGHRIG